MNYKRKIYFIQEHAHEQFFHGGIGPADIERLLMKEGAVPVFFPCNDNFSIKAKIIRFGYLLRMLLTIKRGAVVFFQYPLYARMHKLLLRLLRFRKNVILLCLIDEINGLKYGDEALLAWEKQYFAQYRYFIVHNEAMESWLKTFVPGRVSVQLHFFDFLTAPVNRHQAMKPSVVFAGNLAESDFQYKLQELYTIAPELVFHLYGHPVPDLNRLSANIVYKGVFTPYELPGQIEASFGLVWDGEEMDSIAGSFGLYMQYISHHKVSLYILCHIPLIVYEKAGTATLINHYDIGFTIRNLKEIPEKLSRLTPARYQQFCDNTRILAMKLSKGQFFIDSLNAILEKMEATEVEQGKKQDQ